jgi:hypothetical protein
MNYFNPCPKKKPIRLKGSAYTKLKKEVYKRDKGRCQAMIDDDGIYRKCNRWVPLKISGMFIPMFCAHLSHLKHGSQKEDTPEGTQIECPECHDAKHRAIKHSYQEDTQ